MSDQDLYTEITIAVFLFLSCVFMQIKNIEIDFRDALLFSGIGLIGIGIFMIHKPAAFIAVGSMLFWVSKPK